MRNRIERLSPQLLILNLSPKNLLKKVLKQKQTQSKNQNIEKYASLATIITKSRRESIRIK